MSLKKGDKVPQFKGKLEDDTDISAGELLGQKYALYFYPKDNTPTCTKQACNLRDNYSVLKKAGFEIYGVSPDSAGSHQKFIDKFNLPFSLIVDKSLEICKQFGVWGEKTNFGRTYMGVNRTTFVIDEKGIISAVIDKVKSAEHHEQLLAI